MSRVVLITGCSSGIGAALAREFHGRGHRVFATARRPDSLAELRNEGIETLALDVNDDASVAAALQRVEALAGRLDILVNNAGMSQVGAVLDLARADLRTQFETNVIAPVAVTRAAFALLRASDRACVVNVGSIVGLFTTPFAGAYCASKAALHALSDAMRMELAPFGIRVVQVQPGGVKSSFGDNAAARLRLPADSVFLPVREGIATRAQAGQQGAVPVEVFVEPVVDRLLSDRPAAVIRGGKGSFTLVWLSRLLPRKLFDAVMAKKFGLAGFRPGR